MSQAIVRIRHILYRLKLRLFTTSLLGEVVRMILWKRLETNQGLKITDKQCHDVFSGYSVDYITNKEAREKFERENALWTFQDDIVYEVTNDIFIEPSLSLAYVRPNLFISQSRSRAHKHVVPPMKYRLFHGGEKKATVIPELIHFDGYAGKNLYHFIDDAVNPLLLVLKSGKVPKDIPVLVHERIYELPFFRYFSQLPTLKACNWVVQKEKELVRTTRMFKGLSSHRGWKDVYNEVSSITIKKPSRRLFLNRKAHYQRNIKNIAEIEGILKQYGFETVYAEDYTYAQQAALFSEVKYLVAIHGAGITNLLHSEVKEVHLLELLSSSLIHPHFYWVFQQIGLRHYDAVVGTAFDVNWNYSIDPREFEQSLRKMVAPETAFIEY